MQKENNKLAQIAPSQEHDRTVWMLSKVKEYYYRNLTPKECLDAVKKDLANRTWIN